MVRDICISVHQIVKHAIRVIHGQHHGLMTIGDVESNPIETISFIMVLQVLHTDEPEMTC